MLLSKSLWISVNIFESGRTSDLEKIIFSGISVAKEHSLVKVFLICDYPFQKSDSVRVEQVLFLSCSFDLSCKV